MKEEMFNELLESIKQGGKILKGKRKASREYVFANPDPKEIRDRLGLSQEKFAILLGISSSTIKNWEQGRRKPDGPARILLSIAAKHPEAILDTVYNN